MEKKSLSDRDIEFWKTLANWYTDYEKVKGFSQFILSTTSIITTDSPFSKWNQFSKDEKLECITKIGAQRREREEIFRKQYNRIFDDSFDKNKLLDILDKFIIAPAQTSIEGISKEFEKFVGHIPRENRDYYIGALVGNIMTQIEKPPHIWQITKEEFEKLMDEIGIKECLIDVNEITKLDRARILYNLMYHNGVTRKSYDSIIKNKNYNSIINHKSF